MMKNQLAGLMKQAQAMQDNLKKAQEELANIEVEGQSGGGMVSITLSAKGQMRGIVLDPSLVVADEKDMLEDLILAAHEDARKKGQRLMEEKMKEVTAGLPLPPGMKLF